MAKFPKLFDYTKPGKGLSVEQAEIKGIKGFFTVLKEKIWDMFKINLLFMVFHIPVFIIYYLLSQLIVPGGTAPTPMTVAEYPYVAAWNGINIGSSMMLSSSTFWTDFILRLGSFVFLISTPMLAIGPLQAGFSYIFQSFVRSNPVFLVSDFFGKAKENLKQSIIVSLIDLAVVFILAFDIRVYYMSAMYGEGGFFLTFLTTLMIMIFVIYLVMHMYIYPLMVMFDMTVKQLYKNSFLLTVASFLPAIGVLLIDAALIMIPFFFIRNPLHYIVLAMLIQPALIALINNYFIRSYVNKYLYEPALEMEKEKAE